MFQPLGRFSDVAESSSPITSPITASLSAVLLDIGITWPDCHSRDHWPYSRHRWVLAALTTLARSSVLAASLAHTFLISTIQWITVKELVPAADSLSSGVVPAVDSRLSSIGVRIDLRYDGRYHANCDDDRQ